MTKEELLEILKKLILKANTDLRQDVEEALRAASGTETDTNGLKALDILIENVKIAKSNQVPLCQDTGYVDVYIEGKIPNVLDFQQITDEAIREVYSENNLRNSIVADPIYERKNTGNNTPGNVIFTPTNSDNLKMTVLIKGAGSDNASAVFMLNPSNTEQDIVDLIVNHVKDYGSKSCPPLIIGVGIGSSFDKVASLSKKALLTPTGPNAPDSRYTKLAEKILDEVNNLGIGPSALGGKTTALAVNVETAPCHMATLPVAINLNCYALRSASTVVGGNNS